MEKLVKKLEVPLEVTISNALKIGREPSVACYVAYAKLPKYDESGQFIGKTPTAIGTSAENCTLERQNRSTVTQVHLTTTTWMTSMMD